MKTARRGGRGGNLVTGAVMLLLGMEAMAVPVLEYAPTPEGPWTADQAATIQQTGPYSWAMVTALKETDSTLFYRVTAAEGFDTIELTGIQLDDSGAEIHATGTASPSAPVGMVTIPAGPFQMGDPFSESKVDELPVHWVPVSTFHLDMHEVTKALWDEVRAWALTHGYSFDNAGSGSGASHPVHTVNWYDAVKWCNARSEKEGLIPCYYTSAAQTTAYRTGRTTVANAAVKWEANGYRLPTEAEWEKAARGGLAGMRYPWGNAIDHTKANYDSTAGTRPVGSYAPNDYGVYDVAGNVWEWCWDWHDPFWYARTEAIDADPRGPASGSGRVARGGGWGNYATNVRCSNRNLGTPDICNANIGFRCALGERELWTDGDGDGLVDLLDGCPHDPLKTDPGACGCGVADTDTDGDRVPDCNDRCPLDPLKTEPGVCGCGLAEIDTDSDGDTVPDCADRCPGYDDRVDENGSGVPDDCELTWDTDGDGTPDRIDGCPLDPLKIEPGICGCGTPDMDSDGDTVLDCNELCPGSDDRIDENGNGTSDCRERTLTLPGAVALVLVKIPPGSFQMGSPAAERSRRLDEGPEHAVTIGYEFYMGRYEVTQAQWLALMGSWPGTAPSSANGVGETHPAYFVSWNDAQSFITALNNHIVATGQGPLTIRLPTEAEWEYACRAGAQTRFSFGDSLEVADACDDDGVRSQSMWYCGDNTPSGAKPVGTKMASAFGLCDMHGNVWEWCEDWYHSSYTGAPADGSAWVVPAASGRVIRSGSWEETARLCRSAVRISSTPTSRNYAFGFRVAADE